VIVGFEFFCDLRKPAECHFFLLIDSSEIGNLPDSYIRESAFGEDPAGALIFDPELFLTNYSHRRSIVTSSPGIQFIINANLYRRKLRMTT